MAPTSVSQTLCSPAELSYLHSSLSLTPPTRPDLRTPSQFRPLVAESNILPGTYGSARICFADGIEAIVGVKAEVEQSSPRTSAADSTHLGIGGSSQDDNNASEEDDEDETQGTRRGKGQNAWVELAIEIPGYRDDDTMPVFLAAMLNEALVASGDLPDRLYLNRRFHWKLYIDILLLSPPLSYPLPLLSLTTHLALLSTNLPKQISELDEDPLFSDDWVAAKPLYPPSSTSSPSSIRPPITLLVMAVGDNIIFDPAKEELAVADVILAISVSGILSSEALASNKIKAKWELRLLSLRVIDPPSRMTPPGLPNFLNTATGGSAPASSQELITQRESGGEKGVWTPPRGGVKRGLIRRMIGYVLEKGGVAEEILDGLEAVDGR
ncbi:MAG: hypothetical protein M1836_004740 [Candelina mexicana]|nr:MAG: hypothetical protein M1836_004740 [Candelina mexicana]